MQHINFYGHLVKAAQPLLPMQQQLQLLGIFALLMVFGGGALLMINKTGSSSVINLQQEQTRLALDVEVLRSKKIQQENDPVLAADISGLEQGVRFRQQLLATLGNGDQAMLMGFAGHLEGLARQTMNGMWFTDVQLSAGGRQMALAGQARKPEYVPQYLQRLSEESVFKGQHFRVFRMNVDPESPAMRFEIRAQEAGQ